MKKMLLPLLMCCMPLVQAADYSIVDRAKLFDDKMKTMEMLNPYGHDFYLGINAALTTEITDLVDKATDVGSNVDDVNAALSPFYDKEQALRAKLEIGFPLPSFSAFNINFTPDFELSAGLLTMLTPSSEFVTLSTVIENLDQIPADIRDSIQGCIPINGASGANCSLSEGDDILQCLVDSGTATCDVSQEDVDLIKEVYGIDSLPYIADIDDQSSEVPVLHAYAKMEVKSGVKFKYETEDKHIFGHLALNALGRLDIYKYADASLLLGGGGDMEINNNMLMNMTLDYKLGYRNTNYSVFTSIEDVKVSEISSEEVGTPAFGTDPLIRLHSQFDYKLSIFKVAAFLGSHARSGYGFGDAYYLGADWGVHIWSDRLGLTIRTMLDKEHATLGFRAKMWFFQTDLMAKIAIADQVDNVKVNELYTANIRFFF